MEVFKLELGIAQSLNWPEPARVVFSFDWDGYVHGVRGTHPEEEPDGYLEREAARMSREHKAARNLDKRRKMGSN